MTVQLTNREVGKSSTGPAPRNWLVLLFVLAATFLAYARTLGFGFVHDDFVFLVNNPAIHSWSYLPQYFTASVWEGIYPGVPGNYYRPVFLIWMRLQDALFGGQAGLWHLTTVATHLLTTMLAYYLALRILQDRYAATVAALIFGLHPIHIEAVAWVSGVTEPLVGAFFIGGFLCYLKMRDGGGKARMWLAAALILYIVGLLEKETAILLPAIICAYEWIYSDAQNEGSLWSVGRARLLKAIRAAAPFFLVTVPYLIVRIIVLKGFSHPATRLSLGEIVFTWPSLTWFWIRHLAAPVGLGTFYNLRTVEHPGWQNFLIPLIGTIVVGGLLFWGARRSRVMAFSAAWVIVPLLPFFDLRMFNHNNFAQDRFLYLPSLGVALIAARAFRKLPFGATKFLGFGATRALCMVGLAALLGLGTWRQSFYFKNNLAFYRYNYFLSPGNAYAANDYGVMLELLGMKQDAVKVLEQAVADDPGYRSAAYNLGRLYYEQGRLDASREYLLKAIAMDPSQSQSYYCLGLTELEARHLGEAEKAFRTALKLNPHGKEYHYQLGLALEAQGDTQGALEEYQAELAGNPTHPYARQRTRAIEDLIGRAEER